MFSNKEIEKRKDEDRIKATNCYDCGVKLITKDVKKNPESVGDSRNFCGVHFKLRYGKKRKLIKRY